MNHGKSLPTLNFFLKYQRKVERQMKGLTIRGCVVLDARSTVLTFAGMTLYFVMSLKNIFCTFKSQPKRMQLPPKLICHILQLQVDVGCNRTLSKLSNVNKNYCSYLVVTNIENKQVQQHIVLQSTFMHCTTMQMQLCHMQHSNSLLANESKSFHHLKKE